ncbi:hypothetical protein ACLOJK_028478 [Asimina triloba]
MIGVLIRRDRSPSAHLRPDPTVAATSSPPFSIVFNAGNRNPAMAAAVAAPSTTDSGSVPMRSSRFRRTKLHLHLHFRPAVATEDLMSRLLQPFDGNDQQQQG